MSGKHIDVSRLNEARIRSLLELGMLPQASRAAFSVLDTLAKAAEDPGCQEICLLVGKLRSAALARDAGPLSFSALAALTPEESEQLKGMSLTDALTGPSTGRSVLEKLAKYGELLSGEAFHPSTQLSGVAVRVLALAALWTQHGLPADPAEAQTTVQVLQALAALPVLPQQVQQYARQAAARLQSADTSAGH